MLVPELGRPPVAFDGPTLVEAIRCAFEAIAERDATAMVLDDLQWADEATLELLPVLAWSLERARLLVLALCRSDEITRDHPFRRLRGKLRRSGRLREVSLEPLDIAGTAALAAALLGRPPSFALATALYDRTEGIPFFVEELVGALEAGGRLREGPAGAELVAGGDVPIPETIRDAILMRVESLGREARGALEAAAVVGLRFDLELVAGLAGEEGLEELLEGGLAVEVDEGVGAFPHALAREAFYRNVPWTRRRLLHRQVAELLEAAEASPSLLAEHWLAGRVPDRARPALLAAAEAFCGVHAYRDAARCARRALALWPEGEEEAARLSVLERLGHCAEISGEPGEAARAWAEVADARRLAGDVRGAAELERRLATVYETRAHGSGRTQRGARRPRGSPRAASPVRRPQSALPPQETSRVGGRSARPWS